MAAVSSPLPLLIPRITPLNRSPEIRPAVPTFTQVTSPTSPLPAPVFEQFLSSNGNSGTESHSNHMAAAAATMTAENVLS